MAHEFISLLQNSNALSCRPVFLYQLWQELLASRPWIRWNEVTSRGGSKQPELRAELVHLNAELVYQVVISKVISCHFWFLSRNTIWFWSHLFTEELTASQAGGQSASCGSEMISTSCFWRSNTTNRGKHCCEQQGKQWELGAPEDALGATCIWNPVILILQ